jgi:hypothetical protein
MVQSEIGRHIRKCFTFPTIIIASPILAIFELAKMNTMMGSLTQVMVTTSSKFGSSTGKLYYPIGIETTGSNFANDKDLREKLWKNSEKWVAKFL